MCFARAGCADEDDVLLVIDELQGFEFLEFGREGLVVLGPVEIHQILFDGEFGILDTAGDGVLSAAFDLAQEQVLQEIGVVLLCLSRFANQDFGVVADVGQLEPGGKFLYVRHFSRHLRLPG